MELDNFDGFFLGKYISLREAGNIPAGVNASSHGASFMKFEQAAGAYNSGSWAGGKFWNLSMNGLLGITYGNAPNYGENDYQRTRSEFGYYPYQSGLWP